MERIFYLLKQSLFVKFALVATLVIGGGNSVWAQKSLPYEYGFENNNLAAEGWTISSHQANTAIYNSSNYPGRNSSTYLFRFYTGYESSPVYQHLISPELSNSSTGIIVSFYYNLFVLSSATREFGVGYSTTDTEVSSFTFTDYSVTQSDKNWYKFTNNFPTGTKYVAIRYKGSNTNFFIDDFSVEVYEVYKRPKSLLVSSFTNSSATFAWTNGSDENAWQIAYSTKENFNPDTEGVKVDVTENPYRLDGLTEGVTYYAYVRANYNGNYSAWSNKTEFRPSMVLLLNDETSESTYAPIHNNTNYGTVSQFVIPSSKLISINNRLITKLTFYTKESAISWTGTTFDVYLDVPETTTYTSSGVSLKDWGTKVVSAKEFSVSDGKLQIVLDTPFKYSSGNLLIGIQENGNTLSSVTSTWLGTKETTNYTSAYTYKYSSTGTQYTGSAKFSPKTYIETASLTILATLGTNGYTTFACPRPLDLSALPEGLKAYKAAVEGDKVKFTEISQAVPANTGVLLAGEANGTYDIPFADSGIAPDDNEFLVNSVGGTFTADDGYTYYGLIKNTLTFGTFAPGTVAIPTNKAYLKVANTPTGEARVLTCSFFDETTTGIMETRTESIDRLTTTKVFNLAGQQIANPTKGFYIINGKKHIIK